MKTTVTRATLADARALVMRAEDEAECRACGYASGLEALEAGLAGGTETWAVSFDGEVGVVVGVEALAPRQAYIWCLTGEVVDRAKLAFWRVSRAIVEQARQTFGELLAVVDDRYVRARAWLERLGFVYRRGVMVGGFPFSVMSIEGR